MTELTKTGSAVTLADAGKPDKLVPVRPKGIGDEEDAQLRREAKATAAAILADPTNVQISISIYRIGEQYAEQNTQLTALMETKIGAVIGEIETGNPTSKSLVQVKAQMDLVNPKVVAQQEIEIPSRVAGFLWRTTTRMLPKGDQVLTIINARRDTVAQTISGVQAHLRAQRDTALRNAVELGQISDKLYATQQGLLRAIYSGQLLWAELNEGRALEADKARQQTLLRLTGDLAVNVIDLQTVDAFNTESRLAAELLIGNCTNVVTLVKRVANILLPAVSTNLGVKAAARQQMELAGNAQMVMAAAEELLVDTARDTSAAVVQMHKLVSEAMVNPEKLKEACDIIVQTIDEIDRITAETETKARATSTQLSVVADTMRKTADPMTQKRRALQAIAGEAA